MSANRKRITIITSPSSSTKSLPAVPGSSPTTGKPVQYRIEERKRTVYVTSDVAPTEWDQESLDTIFNSADIDESEHNEANGEEPIRRTRSLVETQIIITEDNSFNNPVYDAREMTPRLTPNRLLRPGNKSPPLQVTRSAGTLPGSPRRSPVQPRRKILFYHKNDPYYGFTNFSAHPVIYRGKRYPTSEHLFQSFKV
jgi:diaminohydroxyphosphoribosylaminopyrimidine deaminase/5-amino-6-(5-phosphoribosylamino)uracil reductase